MSTLSRLYEEADRKGIQIYYFPMRSITAISTPDNVIAIDVDKLDGTYAEAACLAHEMGHCETGGFYTVNTSCVVRARCEERANRWAYKKLIPYAELRAALDSGITLLHELSEYFEVPEGIVEKSVAYYRDAAGLLPCGGSPADTVFSLPA